MADGSPERGAGEAPDANEVAPFLGAIFASSRDPIGVARGLTLCAVNGAYLELFGYERPEEVLGTSVLDLVAPSARPMVIELARRRSMGESVPPSYLTRALRKDGSEMDLETRSTSFQVGSETFILAMHREVQADRGASSKLGGEDFYRALFEVNPAIKLLISPVTGFVLDANQAAIDFYGWSLDELRQMRITDINTLTDREVREEMENARTGRRRYFRFRHRVASGEVRHVEVHSGPVDIGGEQLLLSIIHDVTERNALERQLRESQRLEAVGRLAGSIAHDFNNLLTVVLTSSEMLARKLPEDSVSSRLSEELSSAAQRAVELTRDLLAFSRRQLMRPTAVDLSDSVFELGGVLQRLLGDQVTIVTDLASELPATRMDPRQLEQVLMNLVLNARDAMPAGGTVFLTTALQEVDGEPHSVPAGSWVTVRVRDDGVGMDEATRQRIFEPFFTTKGERQGAGLGLASVYGIVAQSGGHITVESEVGEGTEIALYLPVTAELPEESPVPAGPPASAPPLVRPDEPTVLLVDDQESVRDALASGLEDAGYRVLSAGSSDEALEIFAREPIQAVVTDIVMAGRSGVELAAVLLDQEAELPVLLISGDLRGHELGGLPSSVRRLQKPFTVARLVAELESMLT